MSQFDLEFLQAVNDWQRGGDHKQKVRRGATLKERSLLIHARFRTCAVTCFRQEAHEKDRVWQLLADNTLDETIAAWTVDLQWAMGIKGGVPPPGLQGVIFEITPPAGSVVLNLVELYADDEFLQAAKRFETGIIAYCDGIGRYGSSQQEVVLDLGNLAQAQIKHYGGYPSGRRELAEMYFGRTPSEDDLDVFDELCERAGVQSSGGWWLSSEGTRAVLARVRPHLPHIHASKAAQSDAMS